MFYSGTLLRTIAQETASQIALRDCPKEVRGEPGYIGVFAETNKQCSQTSKMTANHKNRHLKLMILVLFYIWEVVRIWAHWNYSFAMHLNYTGPVLCFSPSWIPLTLGERRGGGRLEAAAASVADVLMVGSVHCFPEWQATFFVHNDNDQIVRTGVGGDCE